MSAIIEDFEKLKDTSVPLPGIFELGYQESTRARRWATGIVESKRIELEASSDSVGGDIFDETDIYFDVIDRLAHDQYALSKCMPQIESVLDDGLSNFLNKHINDVAANKYSTDDYSVSAFGSTETLLGVTSAFETIEKVIDKKQYGFGAETPTGLCLEYRGAPAAIVAFGTRLGRIAIEQIQGIKPLEDARGGIKEINTRSTLGLDWHDWRALMVDLVNSTAKCIGYSVLSIESAKKNRWTQITYPDGSPHLPLDRGLEIYDGTAKRLGFELGADGDWHRNVT